MWTTNHDVWTVPVTGGAATKLTPNPAADMRPVYSRTASRSSCAPSDAPASRPTAGISTRTIERPERSARCSHRPTCRWTTSSSRPTESTIWFTAAREGTGNLYTVPAAGGTPKLVGSGRSGRRFQPADGFALFAKIVARRTARSVSASGRRRRRVSSPTRMAAGCPRVDLPNPTSLTATGAGGHAGAVLASQAAALRCRRRSIRSSSSFTAGRRAAGRTPGRTRWNPSLWAAQGWVVAAPNPRGSTGFGQKYVDEISQDWCGKAMTDLDAVFDAVSASPTSIARGTGIAGASYGGYAVDWLIGTHESIQGRGDPRRCVQPRVDGARHRGAVVPRVGVRRPAVERHGAAQLRAMLAASVGRPRSGRRRS